MRGGSDSATRLDAAIDELLDGGMPLLSVGDGRDVELMATARLLHEALPRFHPRFGFEERLAASLTGAARVDDMLGDAGEPRALAPSPPRSTARRRGLLAGGAIASGLSLAIPLAGAALVAWRRSRPTGGVG